MLDHVHPRRTTPDLVLPTTNFRLLADGAPTPSDYFRPGELALDVQRDGHGIQSEGGARQGSVQACTLNLTDRFLKAINRLCARALGEGVRPKGSKGAVFR